MTVIGRELTYCRFALRRIVAGKSILYAVVPNTSKLKWFNVSYVPDLPSATTYSDRAEAFKIMRSLNEIYSECLAHDFGSLELVTLEIHYKELT